jgi:hypothetical protein
MIFNALPTDQPGHDEPADQLRHLPVADAGIRKIRIGIGE